MRRTVFLQCHYTALYYECLLCGFKKLSSNVLTHGASVRLPKTPHEKEVSSSTERVKQNFSCIPLSCPRCCVAVTLTPPLAPVLPIRALLSIQPLKLVCLIGRGRWWWGVLSAFFSPSLPECFSLTVCDSCTGNCSHTLSPPEVDHVPFLLNSTSPHCSPQIGLLPLSRKHTRHWGLSFLNRLPVLFKSSLLHYPVCSVAQNVWDFIDL